MSSQVLAGLRFAPILPWPLVAGLGVICLLALGIAIWRRAPGVAWRGLAFAVVLLWLAGPRLVQENRTPLPDIGILVIDQTASMQVGARAALAEAARAALQAQVSSPAGARAANVELRVITVPEAGQDGTRLFAAIDRAVALVPHAQLAGIVVVSDGMVHDAPAASNPYGVPIHVLLTGAHEETDRRLRLIEAPAYGVVGKSVKLVFSVDDLGVANPRGEASVTIRRDGDPSYMVTTAIGQPYSLDLPITREGPSVIELTAAPLPGEASALNNRAVVEVNGVRDRLRVLLVSGEPHAGERTWRRLLKADPSVDLVHFTILRPPEKDDLTPLNELALIAFPTRELFQQKIGEFDLIILDRFQNRGILPLQYLRNIADYVRRGGALLMSVGPEFTGPTSLDDSPLHAILPAHPVIAANEGGDGGDSVIEGGFRPLVTALGSRHPVTAALPGWHSDRAPDWGQWYRRIAVGAAQGESLMTATADGAPLLLLDHVDRGRVALLLSDQIWLWSRAHEGGGPQAELLRRVAHWLMRQPALEENALEAKITAGAGPGANLGDGQLSITRRSLQDAMPPPVRITRPDGQTQTLPLVPRGPGVASLQLPASMPGVWQVSDGTRIAYAAAGTADPLEISDLRATASILAPIVAGSGGSVHWLAAADASGAAPELRRTDTGRAASGTHWIGLPARDAHVVTALDTIPVLPDWLALALLLGLVLLAWWREAA